MRLIILLYLLLPLSAFAQYNLWDTTATSACGFYHTEFDRQTIDYFYEGPFCWKDWEKNVSKKKKEKIKKQIKGEKQPGELMKIDEFGHYSGEGDTVRTKFNTIYMHVIDYDGDGDDDFIYEHMVYWEKTLYLEFWLNTGKTWEFQHQVEGHVLTLEKERDKPIIFTTYHNHCCGDYTHYFYTFSITEEPVLLKKESFIGNIPQSQSRIHISSKYEDLQLHNDTLFCYGGRIHGNKRIKTGNRYNAYSAEPSAVIKGQTTASILGILTDRNERKWYLVKLNPSTEFHASAFEKDHRNHWFNVPTTYMGWISERAIKKK